MATRKKAKAAAAKANSGFAGRVFDARPDRLDFRDLPYRPPLRSLPPGFPLEADVKRLLASYVKEGLILNQGQQGACTGFGLASVANYLLWARHLEAGAKSTFAPVSPRMIFELAKRYDEWPGVEYDYSSCRGALKGWHKHGVCSHDHWPWKLDKKENAVYVRPQASWAEDAARRPLGVYYRIRCESVVDVQAAIFNIGAVYVSACAHDGWDALQDFYPRPRIPARHADLPIIPPLKKRSTLSGHAFALVGFNDHGFIVQNSWGTDWGASGFGVLPYDDWAVNSTDAWVCALGVPVSLVGPRGAALQQVASRWRVAAGRSLSDFSRSAKSPANPATDPWPIDHDFAHAPYQPWSTDAAYEHTLVTGNEGELVVTDLTRSALDQPGLVQEIVHALPLRWLKKNKRKTLKLAIYAHGGLNDQDASIRRIRVLAPYFEANGIYPLFLTWKTGVGETLGDLAQDWVRKLFGEQAAGAGSFLDMLGDAKDRAVEALAHVLGKGLWSEMRENAARGVDKDHGLALLAQNLAALNQAVAQAGATLELHLVGHSAGSILLGHFLSLLPAPAGASALRIATATLMAPACSTRFALDHYGAAAQRAVLNLSDLWLHVLSDENEKGDGLPTPELPAYGKSLLYLVSRALDDARKMPLLGMERVHLPKYANDSDQWDRHQLPSVQGWQALWPAGQVGRLHVTTLPKVRISKAGDQAQATHGSFDNNIAVITATIERIAGQKLVSDIEWLDY